MRKNEKPIGEILINSFIDYPGKIAAVIFFNDCNLKCPYCHNPDLAKALKNNHSYEDAIEILSENKMFIESIVLTGGEVTLQPPISLIYFIDQLKDMFNCPVKIDTNGTNPSTISWLLDHNCIDYLALDLKIEQFDDLLYIKNIYDMRDMIINNYPKLQYEVRTTFVEMPHKWYYEFVKNILKKFDDRLKYFLQKIIIPQNNGCLIYNKDSNINIIKDDELETLRQFFKKYDINCFIRRSVS